MKKLLFAAAFVVSVGAAFATSALEEWTLIETSEHVFGTEQEIKSQYCPGPDNVNCAAEVGGTRVILKP
jgi:hypothetical protein